MFVGRIFSQRYFAQGYFALQTRQAELIAERIDQLSRLETRERLRVSEKQLSRIIYERGVDDLGFARIRSKGDTALFGGYTTEDMKKRLLPRFFMSQTQGHGHARTTTYRTRERIEKVAKTYNKKHGNAYSFNISPTIMKCKTLQSQGDCGMGLTLTMNF